MPPTRAGSADKTARSKKQEYKSLPILRKGDLLHETMKILFGNINDHCISHFKLCSTFHKTVIYTGCDG